MDEGIRLRVADAPLGGARIAWSYLGSLIAALLATLFWSAWSPFGTLRCDAQDTTCLLGWNITGWVLGMALSLGLAAFVLRLGWEWWALAAAVLLGAPLWADGASSPVIGLVAALTPRLAAVLTWRGPPRPRWRPWLIGALLVVVVVGSVVAILLAA